MASQGGRGLGHGHDSQGPGPHRVPRRAGYCLGAVHHRSDDRGAAAHHAAVRQADPRLARDAAPPARAAGPSGQVQGQEGPRVAPAHERRDDGALSQARDQPHGLLPADPGADAHLLRPVPGAGLPGCRCCREVRPPLDRSAHAAAGRAGSGLQRLRRQPVLLLPGQLRHAGQDRHGRHDHHHVGDAVVHHGAAVDEEHVDGVPQLRQPHDPFPADDAVRDAGDLRRLRRQLPDRCARLLGRLQPVDHGPAVLHHPQHARSRKRGREEVPCPHQCQAGPQGTALPGGGGTS